MRFLPSAFQHSHRHDHAPSKIGLQKWIIGIYLWSISLKGVSSMRLHRDLKITQKSAYFMAARLREAWTDSGGVFAGPIEVDEAYFGGKRKNMSNAKRKELRAQAGVLWARRR